MMEQKIGFHCVEEFALGIKDSSNEKEIVKITSHETNNSPYERGYMSGLWRELNIKNNIVGIGSYKKGKKEGIWKYINKSNTVDVVEFIHYHDDKKDGSYKKLINNQVCITGTFKKDKMSGEWNFEKVNGDQKRINATYKNGVEHGDYKIYSLSGELLEEAGYRKGLLHGKHNKYQAGKIYETLIYKKGILKQSNKSQSKEGAVVEEKTDGVWEIKKGNRTLYEICSQGQTKGLLEILKNDKDIIVKDEDSKREFIPQVVHQGLWYGEDENQFKGVGVFLSKSGEAQIGIKDEEGFFSFNLGKLHDGSMDYLKIFERRKEYVRNQIEKGPEVKLTAAM